MTILRLGILYAYEDDNPLSWTMRVQDAVTKFRKKMKGIPSQVQVHPDVFEIVNEIVGIKVVADSQLRKCDVFCCIMENEK